MGVTIQIDCRRTLARSVALVLAQEYTAAYKLAHGLVSQVPKRRTLDAEAIIAERLRTIDNSGAESEQVRYQRDGLLFQLIMWLASHTDSKPSDVILPPHLIPAHKGVDAAIVHLSNTSRLSSVSICEDKATERARDTIRDEVWPEVRECEAGKKDDELRTFAIEALIRRGVSPEQAETTAAAILWGKRRRYRVRSSVSKTHSKPPERGHLFRGFEAVAPGNMSKRRGETLHIVDLRAWMSDFASEVEGELRKLASG